MPYDRLDVLDVASGGIGTVKEIAAGDCVWSEIDRLLPFAPSAVERQVTKYSGRSKRLLDGNSSARAAGDVLSKSGLL